MGERGIFDMVRVKIAPDMEFRMEIELEGITMESRDHDLQQHKKEVVEAFMERLRKGFPDADLKLDTFEFGLDHHGAEKLEKAA